MFAHLEDATRPHPALLPAGCSWATSCDAGWSSSTSTTTSACAGTLFRTRTGEVTVRGRGGRAAGQEPAPAAARQGRRRPRTGRSDLTAGFSDPEVRYRQRYADLAVHPEVREVFRRAPRWSRYIRRFLDERGFLEVETPVLQPLYGGAAARPFVTHHNALDMPLYLRIADELYLKRLLVGGLERVYEIGHDFRNEGMDRTHNPEFTMLECYQAYADYHDMMDLAEELLSRRCASMSADTRAGARRGRRSTSTPPFAARQLRRGDPGRAGVDVPTRRPRTMRAAAARRRRRGRRRGARLAGGQAAGRGVQGVRRAPADAADVRARLSHALSPLAKPHRGDPRLTERFELFVGGREMANAFSELNDPDDQRAPLRGAGARSARPATTRRSSYDADYIRALEYGMPPAGGVGIGHRPAGHAAHRPAIDPRRDPVPGHAARGMTARRREARALRALGGIAAAASPAGVAHRAPLPPQPAEGPRRSLNTVISTGGVVVGVTALIVVLGVMNGLRNDLRERILVGQPAPSHPDLRRRAAAGRLAQRAWRTMLKEPDVVAARRR